VERDYSATPLARRLGIEAGMDVVLLRAPEGAEEAMEPLPAGARLLRHRAGSAPSSRGGSSLGADLTLWWPRDRAELDARVGGLAGGVTRAGLWILWPKRSSGVVSDVTEQAVREAGLSSGLVDNKVASFDATWSALRFVPRRGEG